jgi:hypothetical protein
MFPAKPTAVFSKDFFKGWVVVLFLWAFYAAGTITLLPIWEGRKSLKLFAVYIVRGRRGLKETILPEVTAGEEVTHEGVPGSSDRSLEEKSQDIAETKTA